MPQSKLDRIKGIAKSLFSPKAPVLRAEDVMEKRKKSLDRIGPKKSGGMFDVIYKGRKAREDVMKELE